MSEKHELRKLRNFKSIAKYLRVSEGQLRYLLRSQEQNNLYKSFEISKKTPGEVRTICAPAKPLLHIQKKLAEKLSNIYHPRVCTNGFVTGRGVHTNAQAHVSSRFVLNIDLNDFFQSIHFGRIQGLFRSLGVPWEGSIILAQICCFEGSLPQGGATSPILSNMICKKLDIELTKLAFENKCKYSRYADDITFSKKQKRFSDNIVTVDSSGSPLLGRALRETIERNDFTINSKKTRLLNNTMSQRVTGLVVNSKVNVPRTFVRQVRAMIHAWRVFGREAAFQKHRDDFYRRTDRIGKVPDIADIIKGKLAYLKMVKGDHDGVYKNLQRQFVTVFPEYIATIEKERNLIMLRDVFISHASPDKDTLVRPLAEQLLKDGFSVWYDEYEISVGDSIRAKIEEGLANSSCGIVVLSEAFFDVSRKWPGRELDGLFSKEDASGNSLILPVWFGVDQARVAQIMPMVAGLRAAKADGQGIVELASELERAIKQRKSST